MDVEPKNLGKGTKTTYLQSSTIVKTVIVEHYLNILQSGTTIHFLISYFQLDDKCNYIDAVLNQIEMSASNQNIRKIIVDFVIAKEEQIYIAYNNFFKKKRCAIDTIIALLMRKAIAPPSMFDFLTILLGDFLNVKIALICAVGLFTNLANILQQDINDE